MGYTFDYFVAELKCPICGNISEADTSTNMQTYIREKPELASLSTGDELKLPPNITNQKDYLLINMPKPDEEIRILQTWECPKCGSPFNWAEIVLFQDRIKDIYAVSLTKSIFLKAHLISDECISIAHQMTGLNFEELVKQDIVQILMDNL